MCPGTPWPTLVLHSARSHILWSNPIRAVSRCLLSRPRPTSPGLALNGELRFGLDLAGDVSPCPLDRPHLTVASRARQKEPRFGVQPRQSPMLAALSASPSLVSASDGEPQHFGFDPLAAVSPGLLSAARPQPRALHPTPSHVLRLTPAEPRPGGLSTALRPTQSLVSDREPRFAFEPCPGGLSTVLLRPQVPCPVEEPRFRVDLAGDAPRCPRNRLHPASGAGTRRGATF